MLNLFKSARLRKTISIVTAACFTFSIFASNVFAAPAPVQPVAAIASVQPVEYVIPFNIGRVTDSLQSGSENRVLVNIQDLHAHEETQRNISSILALLDAKYGINKIYVEGATGHFNTNWLSGINNDEFRNTAINTLMRDGKLSGAEYYSIQSGKADILQGIENKELYTENFIRLNEIYAKRGEIQELTPVIKLLLNNISEQYYSKNNKKLLRVLNKYQSGNMTADKYFRYLVNKAGESGVNFANYETVVNFARIASVQSSLNSSKINSQILEFVDSLKSDIPYSEYKVIADMFGKAEQEGSLYLTLADAYYTYNYSGKYTELEKFFAFMRLNQAINPVDLVMEEKQLAKEIMYRFAGTDTEKEIIFLNDMFNSFTAYLDNKISAKEYDFIESNMSQFKILWMKYIGAGGISELNAYYDLFDQFYKVNIERNRYFLKEITEVLPKQAEKKIRLINSDGQKTVSQLLAGSKNIDVVITGGFHTHDLARLMGDNSYNYIVITPNVTQNTILSDENYENNILRQSEIFTNTFKDIIASAMLGIASNTDAAAKAAIAKYTPFTLLEEAEKSIGLSAFSREVIPQMINSDTAELNGQGIYGLVTEITKEGDGYHVTLTYKDAKGQTQTPVSRTINRDADRQNFDVKEQRRFNVAAAVLTVAASVAAGILLAPAALPVVIALGVAGLIFNKAGLMNAKLVSMVLEDDFANYVSSYSDPYKAPEEKIGEIAALSLPNGMAQDEFLKNFEDSLRHTERGEEYEAPRLASEITLKSIFDPSAPADIASKMLSTIATVSESDPNVIYVNPIALFFMSKRAPGLAEDLIANHEQLHTKIGGSRGEIITSIKSTYNFKAARNVLSAYKRSKTETQERANLRRLYTNIMSYGNNTLNYVEERFREGVLVDFDPSTSHFYANARDFFKMLEQYPYLVASEIGRIDVLVDTIAGLSYRTELVRVKEMYREGTSDRRVRDMMTDTFEKSRKSIFASIESMFPGKHISKSLDEAVNEGVAAWEISAEDVMPKTGINETQASAYRKLINELIELKQKAVLATLLRLDDAKKIKLLDSIASAETQGRGLSGYIKDFTALAEKAKDGYNPFEKKQSAVPSAENVKTVSGLVDQTFEEYSEEGVKHILELGLVILAGGVGDRLGFNGIKVGIEESIIDGKSYLEAYIDYLDGLAAEYKRRTGEATSPVVAMMTSDSTHDNTVAHLQSLGYTATEVEVAPGIFRTDMTNNARATNKVFLMKQRNVPAILDYDGNLSLIEDADGNIVLETKPHGHGDVHALMNKMGVAKDFARLGKKAVMFIQDTNGPVMNGVLPMLGMMRKEGKPLVIASAVRSPGEPAGALLETIDENGKRSIENMEYNYIKDAFSTEDEERLNSGNINVYMFDLAYYTGILERTGGVIAEFVNPKKDPANPERFTAAARAETMMQDIYPEAPITSVMVLNFEDKRLIFSPVKNGILKDGKVTASFTDTMVSGEEDYHQNGRKLLREAGVEVALDGQDEITIQGKKHKLGARVILGKWGYLVSALKSRFSGINKISDRSVVNLTGEVGFNNLDVDGALKVTAAEGVSVVLSGEVKNAGYEYMDFTQATREKMLADGQTDRVAQYEVRGYFANPVEELDIEITIPGSYEVTIENGQVIVKNKSTDTSMTFESGKISITETGATGDDVVFGMPKSGINSYQEKQYLAVINTLQELNQRSVLEILAKLDDAKKIKLLESLVNAETHGRGLKGYIDDFKSLAEKSKDGYNPFEKKQSSVPSEENVKTVSGMVDQTFEEYSEEGVKHILELGLVILAGGVGDRLGFDGIKVGIEESIVEGKTYLETYIDYLDGLANEYERRTGKKTNPVVAMMTSDSTHDNTVKLLESLGYSSIEVEVLPGIFRTEMTNNTRATNKVFLMKQRNVPAILDYDGNLSLIEDADGDIVLETKPHGHGDVHALMNKMGVAKEFAKLGKKAVMFIQDTNGSVMNGALPMLGMMRKEGKSLVIASAMRSPGEPAGALLETTDENGKRSIENMEYNYIKDAFSAADEERLNSGNINVYMFDLAYYAGILERTGGVIAEFVNPKKDPNNPSQFTAAARAETMMQDIYPETPIEAVGVLNFEDKRLIFSPVKNAIMKDGKVAGSFVDTMVSGEEDYHQNGRKLLKEAGVDVELEGKDEIIIQGKPQTVGARVVLNNWSYVLNELRDRFTGMNRISDRSAVNLSGNIGFNGFDVDGAVKVHAANGVTVTLRGEVKNAGYRYSDFTAEMRERMLSDGEVALVAQNDVRGYVAEKEEELDISITVPGDYEVNVEGNNVIVTNKANNKKMTFSANEPIVIDEALFRPGLLETLGNIFDSLAQRLKIALRNLLIGKSYVDIKAPELKGKSYTFVLDEYSPGIMKRAKNLAAKGISVNIIMPMARNKSFPEGVDVIRQDMDYAVADDGRRAAVNKYSETDQDTGSEINLFMFSQIDFNSGEITTEGVTQDMTFALKTLEWLKERAIRSGKYDFGIIDIQRGTNISFDIAQNMFPDAVIAKSIEKSDSTLNELALREQENGIMPYLEGREEVFLANAGEMLRNRSKNKYMKTSPIFSTTADLSRIALSEFDSDAAIKEVLSYGFDTLVLKLDANNVDVNLLRSVLKRAHANGVKIVIEYAFSSNDQVNSWVDSLTSQLKEFRASTGIVDGAKEFVDGIRLDLSAMSEADAKEASKAFSQIRNIINGESSDALFGVKSSYYDEALYTSADIRPVKTVSHANKDGLNAVNNAWVEFSIGEESYNQQSMDYSLTAEDVENVVNAKTTGIVGIDWYVIKALKKAEDKAFSTLDMIRSVFLKRTSIFRNSPEGTFNSARATASRLNVQVSQEAEADYYNALSVLRSAINDGDIKQAISSIDAWLPSDSALLSDLASRIKNASDAEKAKVLMKNIEGHIQGALENTELTTFEKITKKKINYVVGTNKDLFAKALVDAKLLLAQSGAQVKMSINNSLLDAPYKKELDAVADGVAAENAQLQKAKKLMEDLQSDDILTSDAFAIIQEAINILGALTESGELADNKVKAVALATLLDLLALKSDYVPEKITDTASAGLQNVAATTRALLAAA